MTKKEKLTSTQAEQVSRKFNILFNQILMYNYHHPVVERAYEDLYTTLKNTLNIHSSIAIIYNQGRFFVEDIAFDTRLNVDRLTNHFKEYDIQSILFEKGVPFNQLRILMKILKETTTYPNADAMNKALKQFGCQKVRFNYVTYKKITTDDAVVSKEQAKIIEKLPEDFKNEIRTGQNFQAAALKKAEKEGKGQVLSILAESVIMEELEKSVSLQMLIENPQALSSKIIQSDTIKSQSATGQTPKGQAPKGQAPVGQNKATPGSYVHHLLQSFNVKVDQATTDKKDVDLNELAQGVFSLKRHLLKEIETQKQGGIVYLDENRILHEADKLTSNVLVNLIKEEYSKGISIQRLAQIILRLIPEAKELKNLLPYLKVVLLQEGMSLADYFQLVQELRKELQGDELTRILERSATEIGLEGEDLIKEVMKNPQESASLIYLATEIRKETGDPEAISNLLTDYIENIGTEIAINKAQKSNETSSKGLHKILADVRNELVSNLKQKPIQADTLSKIEKKLNLRVDDSIRKLKSSMIFDQIASKLPEGDTMDQVMAILAENLTNKSETQIILEQVRTDMIKKGANESRFHEMYEELMGYKPPQRKKKKPSRKAKTPKSITLNRTSTLFLLDKEIARSNRYDTALSVLGFTIVNATPGIKLLSSKKISKKEIIDTAVGYLATIIRDTDIAGLFDSNMMIILQPMTPLDKSQLSLKRIVKLLKTADFIVKKTPFNLKFAGISLFYDKKETPNLNTYIQLLKKRLIELSSRISSIQNIL